VVQRKDDDNEIISYWYRSTVGQKKIGVQMGCRVQKSAMCAGAKQKIVRERASANAGCRMCREKVQECRKNAIESMIDENDDRRVLLYDCVKNAGPQKEI